jgi:hypothetical protein
MPFASCGSLCSSNRNEVVELRVLTGSGSLRNALRLRKASPSFVVNWRAMKRVRVVVRTKTSLPKVWMEWLVTCSLSSLKVWVTSRGSAYQKVRPLSVVSSTNS